jgi:hypothetical protein
MAGRGVHFALTPEEGDRLLDAADHGEELMERIAEIEERWVKEWLQETEKAWDAIHRCLTGGTLFYGESPLHQCILGEDNLYDGDDYFVNILMPEEVKEVAAAIRKIDKAGMRRHYRAIDPKDYGSPLSDEDFEYTWSWFKPLKRFFRKAARQGRWVVFTTDL